MSFNKDKYNNSNKVKIYPTIINKKRKHKKKISRDINSLNSYKNIFNNNINDSVDSNQKLLFDSNNSDNNIPINDKLNISFISNISNVNIIDYSQNKSKEKKIDDDSSFIDNSLINLLNEKEKIHNSEKETKKIYNNNLKETDNDKKKFGIFLSSKDLLLEINDTYDLKEKLFLDKKRYQNNNGDNINKQKVFECKNPNKNNKGNLSYDVCDFDTNEFMKNENECYPTKITANNKISNILNLNSSKNGNPYEKIKIKNNKIIEVNENKNIISEYEEDNYIDYQEIFENLFF